MYWSFVVRGRVFSVSNIKLEWVLLLEVYARQSTVYCRELHSALCVYSKLLAAAAVVAAAAAARGGGGGDVTIGRSCFTARLHFWRTSHKLNTKFPF